MSPAARIGDVIDGRYRITGVLGRGGMGQVYRAEHVTIGRQLALKLLHHEVQADAGLARRFRREARAAARAQHPNCVMAADFGELPDGTLYLVMEYAAGEMLGDVLAREGKLSVSRALAIARHVLCGLEHVHAQGILHRDVKPYNISLAPRDGDPEFARLLDFGIAKLVGEAAGDATKLTEAGIAVGTPTYFSPEQAFGDKVEVRSDLYAVAVVMFEMLSGGPPYRAADPVARAVEHVKAPIPSLRALAPDVPAAVAALVERGLAKTPEARFPSARAMIEAIDALGQGQAVETIGSDATVPLSGVGVPAAAGPVSAAAPEGAGPSAPAAPIPAPRPSAVAAASPSPVSGSRHDPARAQLRARWALAAAAVGLAGIIVGSIAAASRASDAERARERDALLETLDSGESCEDRRAALLGLEALGDPAAIPELERARRRMRGGVLGLGQHNANRCLVDDVDRAIDALRAP